MWALEILRDLNSDDEEPSIYVSISSLILKPPNSKPPEAVMVRCRRGSASKIGVGPGLYPGVKVDMLGSGG